MRAVVPVLVLVLAGACRPPGYGKHKPDAAGPDVDASTSSDAMPDSPPAAVCHHGFRLDGHGSATSVWLTGDFVQWAGDPPHGAVAFTLGADGGWTGERDFTAGTYQYKFIIDGTQWIPDPANPDTAPDGFGGVNSVYTCTP